MAAQVFLLPDLGEGLTEAVIVRWLVSVGDEIGIDQAIAEVETAKSIVELPSPFAGTVLALHGDEGEAVLTGSPVLEVGGAGDSAVGVGAGTAGSAAGPGSSVLEDQADRTEIEAYRAEERAGVNIGAGAGSPVGADGVGAGAGNVGAAGDAGAGGAASGSGNVLIGYGTESVASKGRRRRKVAVERPGATSVAAPGVGGGSVASALAPASSSLLEIPKTDSGAVSSEAGATSVGGGVASTGGGVASSRGGVAVPLASTSAFGPVAVRSPIVRRLARELGVDPRAIVATGSDGAVTRADVLLAAEMAASSQIASAPGLAPGASLVGSPGVGASVLHAAPAGDEVAGLHGLRLASAEKLSPLRKAVSAKMSRSRAEIPEATVWVDVDFTELWNMRPQMAAAGERPPSITTLIARFVVLALQEYPLLASRLSEDGTELLSFDGINLGIAVDSERGLSVPVLPRAEGHSIAELDVALRELSAEARTGRLAPARLSGSTFTFNNYGGFGVDGSAAIINHPEVAILGMGRVIEKPWVVDGEIVVRRIAQISLAFDHRVCDGGYAAGFIGSLVEKIEHPLRVFSRL